jgi:hypothetical protein
MQLIQMVVTNGLLNGGVQLNFIVARFFVRYRAG